MRPADILSLLRGDPAPPACPETLGETRYRESQPPTQHGPAPRPAPKLPTPQACRGPPGHFRNGEDWFSGCDQQPRRRGEQSTRGIPSEPGCDSPGAAPAALQGIRRSSSWRQRRKLPEGGARHGQPAGDISRQGGPGTERPCGGRNDPGGGCDRDRRLPPKIRAPLPRCGLVTRRWPSGRS